MLTILGSIDIRPNTKLRVGRHAASAPTVGMLNVCVAVHHLLATSRPISEPLEIAPSQGPKVRRPPWTLAGAMASNGLAVQ